MSISPENIEPNELADRYEATKNLYVFLKQIIESFGELNEDGDEPIPEYYRQVKQVHQSLGPAQMHQNPFSMRKYREVHGDLPTLETSTPSGKKRAVLSGIGAIDRNGELPLPVDDKGNRLPLLVSSTDEIEDAIDTLEGYKQHISEKSVKILHVADTHIGFSHRYTDDSGGYTPNHRVDCIEAFEQVVDVAKKKVVDAVVHAGDVFDHYVEKKDIQHFEGCIRDLRESGISFHFVVGDHDSSTATYEGENAVSKLFDMADEGEVDLLDNEPSVLGDSVVSLYGIGYIGLGAEEWDFQKKGWDDGARDKHWWEGRELTFEESPHTAHDILCSHGRFREGGRDMPASEVVDQSNVWFDKLLLGDLHVPTDGVGGCGDAHYAGAAQSISRSKKDIEPRVNIFEFHESGEIEHEEVSIA